MLTACDMLTEPAMIDRKLIPDRSYTELSATQRSGIRSSGTDTSEPSGMVIHGAAFTTTRPRCVGSHSLIHRDNPSLDITALK